ncbi:DUF3019 domain-containing protein [uncultured Microbulbifer sp.]|uniref:DUF3019 domain-containing protein n=1 Tax=uncultured Microbulbifer sp. TaxID=348147 RepID=UPI0025CCF223|nr:DUF3019 domain-containing protein [uncultured Microbulbifer sp.]
MNKWGRLLVSLLWPLLGSPLSVEAADLRVTPSLCAIGEDEEKCSISVTVLFNADDDDRYCLSIVDRGLIECFSGRAGSQLQVYVAADEDIQFQVTEAESGDRVASTILKVAKFRPKRHQRRYGWGLL